MSTSSVKLDDKVAELHLPVLSVILTVLAQEHAYQVALSRVRNTVTDLYVSVDGVVESSKNMRSLHRSKHLQDLSSEQPNKHARTSP